MPTGLLNLLITRFMRLYRDAKNDCFVSISDPVNHHSTCPFTISAYSVRDEPDTVRLSYRIPTSRLSTEEFIEEVAALIESIIEDARWRGR